MPRDVDLVRQYNEGIVCYLDILGFGKFSLNEQNLEKIKNIFSNNEAIKNMQEINHFVGKVLQISDSIFITAKLEEFNDPSYFESIMSLVCLIREQVVDIIGTDVRCGITYGKYVHLDNGTIFGPAVTRAFWLAEKTEKISVELANYLKDNPAKILIDNNLLSCPLNIDNELFDFVLNVDKTKYIKKFDFYLVNPFYFIFEAKQYTTDSNGSTCVKDELVKIWRKRICENTEKIGKYWLTLEMLQKFDDDKNIKSIFEKKI